MTAWRAAVVALGAGTLVAGCSSNGEPGPTPPSTITSTRVVTSSAVPYQPPAATTIGPLPPAASPIDEQTGTCPYIASSTVAGIVGSHVYRTTLLASYQPTGCRFYFYADPYGPLADILPTTFKSSVEARNAMITTGSRGTQVIGQPSLAPGVEGVSFRTPFYGPDGGQDWACAFATGNVMVVIHTQRTDTAAVAVLLARAVVAKF